MRAVWVTAHAPIDALAVADAPDPVASPGELIVDVVAAEANYPDILVIEGRYQVRPPLPFAPGKAAAGHVATLGYGVEGFAVGDAVSVQVEYGAFAEKIRVRADSCFRMPAGMGFDTAAALGLVHQTAWFALRDRARLRVGETVLVLGASGGVGVASVQLAKAMGAGSVIAGVLGPANAEVARAAGADHVVDLGVADIHERLRGDVSAMTDGQGVDIVIDPVGGAAHAAAMRALAWRGRLVVIGFASGEIPTIKANYLLVKNIEVSGLQWSDYRDRTPARVAEAQAEIFAFHEAGKIRPMITRRFPLEACASALDLLKSGQAQGKIILEVGRP